MTEQKKDSILVILELVFLTLGCAFLFFCFYILPRILFDMNYEVPHFVIWLEFWYQKHHGLGAFAVVFMPFLLVSLGCFYIARLIERRLEEKRRALPPDEISDAERFFSQPDSILKLVIILTMIFIFLYVLGRLIDRGLAALLS